MKMGKETMVRRAALVAVLAAGVSGGYFLGRFSQHERATLEQKFKQVNVRADLAERRAQGYRRLLDFNGKAPDVGTAARGAALPGASSGATSSGATGTGEGDPRPSPDAVAEAMEGFLASLRGPLRLDDDQMMRLRELFLEQATAIGEVLTADKPSNVDEGVAQEKLQSILTSEQYAQFMELQQRQLQTAAHETAARQSNEWRALLGLSADQTERVSTALHEVYGGSTGARSAVDVLDQLKTRMVSILSPEQFQRWSNSLDRRTATATP
jgi:hypothetical protein